MAKFVIECPNCGKYAQANNGLLGIIGKTRKIDCSCGYTINVATEKLIGRECPHCGNHVVFDQSKGEKAKCPVCGEPVNTMAEQSKFVEFSCGQCGIRLRTAKGASIYKCPVCDFENAVAERLMNEELRNSGLTSVIKYEGDNETLVWRHPIEDFYSGSQLIVHESQEAIFFRDGQALDLFGSGRYTLETNKLPLLNQLFEMPIENEGIFHSEIYFINMTTQLGIKWGTDIKVRMFDPASGLHVELGASGECGIRVVNSRKLLLKVVGTTGDLKQSQLFDNKGKGFFRAMVMTQVKSFLASTIRENAISILEIDERLMELSDALREKINPRLDEYGIELAEFFISRIVLPDEDKDFQTMKRQYAQQYLDVRQEQIRKNVAKAEAERKAVEAQTIAQMKIISAQGDAEVLKIQKAAEVEAYRMQTIAEAEEMRMKGYTYQQETSRQIGLEAMKNGLTGNDGGIIGGFGELAGLGVTLGAMGNIANMTKEVLNPVMESTKSTSQSIVEGISTSIDTWDCTCGNKGIIAKFCGECGSKRPEIKNIDSWDCPICGNKGIKAKFCGECGAKRPEVLLTWDCACGNKGITGKFCGECGKKRGE